MIATTQDQSQSLLRCGVSADTADMCYDSGTLSFVDYKSAMQERDSRKENYEVTPAWSLSALLAMLPPHELAPHANTPCTLSIYRYPERWLVMYYDGEEEGDFEDYMWQCASEQQAETLIEACVKMIEWLTWNKKL